MAAGSHSSVRVSVHRCPVCLTPCNRDNEDATQVWYGLCGVMSSQYNVLVEGQNPVWFSLHCSWGERNEGT